MPTYRGHEVKTWDNLSKSNPSKPPYKTILWSNGEYTCNCGGWLYPKNGNPRTCTHVRDAEAKMKRANYAPKVHTPNDAGLRPAPLKIPIHTIEPMKPSIMSGNPVEKELAMREQETHQVIHPEGKKYRRLIRTHQVIHPEGKKYRRLIRVAQ